MAVHRRAFALVLVLVAVGATFALAVQGAAAMRSAMAEAAAMRRDQILQRRAVSAASVVLTTLTAGAQRRDEIVGASGGSATISRPAGPNTDDLPDMPQEMKDFLRGLMRDQQNKDPGPASTSSNGGLTTQRTGGAYSALQRRGVPTGPVRVAVEEDGFTVRVLDAGGMVNINRAPRDGLARFFRARGLSRPDAAALADQIADWRDEDSVPREFGAERDDYRPRGVAIRNGRFLSINELLYLPAMTRARLRLLRDDLTLIGQGTVNAGSASRAALLSVAGMTPAAADAILTLRASGEPLTEEDLNDAVGGHATGAVAGLRLEPTSALRLIVTPESGGPALAVDALVDDDRGVRIVGVRLLAG